MNKMERLKKNVKKVEDTVICVLKNFKANFISVKKIFESFNVCFLIEHWLAEEERNFLEEICSEQKIIFNSDFPISNDIDHILVNANMRKLQLQTLFNRSCQLTVNLEKIFNLERAKLCQKISNFRRQSKLKNADLGNKPGPQEFIHFYSTLFTHCDRTSNEEHLAIERNITNCYNYYWTALFILEK